MNEDSEGLAVSTVRDRKASVTAYEGSATRGAPVTAANAVVARFVGFDLDDRPLVAGLDAFPHRVVPAETTVALDRTAIGRRVVLLLENGDAARPIVIGLIGSIESGRTAPSRGSDVAAMVDGERHVIEAEREVVLRCGEASITLTRAGKVIIEGTYIVSRSTGYNRIKGAAVDIN